VFCLLDADSIQVAFISHFLRLSLFFDFFCRFLNCSCPGTHTAYYHPFFHKDRLKAKLYSIKRGDFNNNKKRPATAAGVVYSPNRRQNPPSRRKTQHFQSLPPQHIDGAVTAKLESATKEEDRDLTQHQQQQENAGNNMARATVAAAAAAAAVTNPPVICIDDDSSSSSDLELVMIKPALANPLQAVSASRAQDVPLAAAAAAPAAAFQAPAKIAVQPAGQTTYQEMPVLAARSSLAVSNATQKPTAVSTAARKPRPVEDKFSPHYPSPASLHAAHDALLKLHVGTIMEDSQTSANDQANLTLEHYSTMISTLWDTIQRDSNEKRQENANRLFQEKRKGVFNQTWHKPSVLSKERIFHNRIVTTKVDAEPVHMHPRGTTFVYFSFSSKQKQKAALPAICLEGTEKQQPRHNAPVTIRRWRAAEDQAELEFVPYFSNIETADENEVDLRKIYSTKNREKRLRRGASYEEEEMNEKIDSLLDAVCRKLWQPSCEGKFQTANLEVVRETLLFTIWKVIGCEFCWLEERYGFFLTACLPPRNVEFADNNFKELFCNRCLIYNCDIHGVVEKPSSQLQYEKAHRRMNGSYWKDAELTPLVTSSVTGQLITPKIYPQELSDEQKALCSKLFRAFEGSATKIASALDVPVALVTDFITAEGLQLPEISVDNNAAKIKGRKSKNYLYHSMKHYKREWVDNIANAKNHTWCEPCAHDDPCSEEVCSCVQGSLFCNKNCGHAERSRNFFRGCACTTDCTAASCPCRKSNRECDPDLCKTCGACTDLPGYHEVSSQKCANDNMSMRRHRRLLVGISTIPNAGWGLFTMHPLTKGDFIHEYMGELITEHEADRRGNLYDKNGCTYLFEQSDEFVVDGMNKANKVRFANHSSEPNVEARKMFVNGDIRIGYFANWNIPAQAEVNDKFCTTCGAIIIVRSPPHFSSSLCMP